MSIVILHGWGQNGQTWAGLAEKLGSSATSIDLPGFGNEPMVADNWGIPEYATWVEKKIKAKKDLVILGHSFGGRIAAEIAARKPVNLKGLVLSGAPCLYRPSLSTSAKIKIYKILKQFVPPSTRRMVYSRDLKEAGKLEQIFRKTVVHDQTKQLKKIKVPTLIVWGNKDNEVPLAIGQEMHRLISKSELKIIEGAGHNSYFDKPELFFGYVKDFVSHL